MIANLNFFLLFFVFLRIFISFLRPNVYNLRRQIEKIIPILKIDCSCFVLKPL